MSSEKLSFTMRREFDKHKEEEELIKQLKSVSGATIIGPFFSHP